MAAVRRSGTAIRGEIGVRGSDLGRGSEVARFALESVAPSALIAFANADRPNSHLKVPSVWRERSRSSQALGIRFSVRDSERDRQALRAAGKYRERFTGPLCNYRQKMQRHNSKSVARHGTGRVTARGESTTERHPRPADFYEVAFFAFDLELDNPGASMADSLAQMRSCGSPLGRKLGLSFLGAVFVSLLLSGPAWAPPPAVRPGKPTSVAAMPGNGQAVISWQGNWAPWGYFPDGYVAVTNRGNTCTGSGTFASTCTLTGLTNGLHYQVHVYAIYSPNSQPPERKGPPSVKVKFIPG
jgi:hypothetical protein